MKKNSPLWHWITSQLPTPTEKKSMYSDITSSVVSPYANQSPLLGLFSKKITWSVALCLVVIYTTNQVSASALPGDLSYPIKIAREEVILITKPTPAKKADYLIKRIETRIAEKTTLIETNQLKKEDSLVVDNLIAKTTEQFNTQITDIKTEDSVIALDYQNTMTAILDSHSETLLATSSEEISSTVAVLALEKQQEHASQIKTELENTVLDIDPVQAEQHYYEKIALLNTEYPNIFPTELITPPIVAVAPVVSDDVPAIPKTVESLPEAVKPIATQKITALFTEPANEPTLMVSPSELVESPSETNPTEATTPSEPTVVSNELPIVKKPETIDEFLAALAITKKEGHYAQGIILLSDFKIILQKQKVEKLKQLELEQKKIEMEKNISTDTTNPTHETNNLITESTPEIKSATQ